MTPPKHYIHVYQRPVQGSAFIRRYEVYNYTHSIINRGWFDTAACDVSVRSEAEGQQMLLDYLGAYVAIYVDNPVVPIWEGLINRITFNGGGASHTVSLDEMANRVSVVFTSTTNTATETPVVDNTASQAIYGIKQEQIEFGGDPSVGTQRLRLRDTILTQQAFPQPAVTQSQGDTNIVHFELLGLYHTLEWEKVFTTAVTTSTGAATTITSILAAIANGATFFNNADVSLVTANPSTLTIPDQQRGASQWERIQKIAEAGDGADYWVAGITPTDPNSRRRALYYRIANMAIEYTAQKSDGLRPRNLWGRLIKPWLVVPDRAIRVTDALLGYGGTLQTDPTETYIQSVQYDANAQLTQWFGADDTTARAAFKLNRGFKPLSTDLGAPTRTITT
jgi:hypothetical protein